MSSLSSLAGCPGRADQPLPQLVRNNVVILRMEYYRHLYTALQTHLLKNDFEQKNHQNAVKSQESFIHIIICI